MMNHNLSLSEYLQEASPEQIDRMLALLDPLPLDPRTEERIILRIRQKRAAGRSNSRGQLAAKQAKKTKKGHRTAKKHALRWISAAASILLIVGILSIPSVSRALYSLLHPDYETERYMLDRPEQRTPIPDVEEALAAASPNDEHYYIELLGEYTGPLTRYDEDYNKDIPKLREEMGFPAFDKEQFAFLRNLKPEVREVLYDGSSITVNTYFESDHAADFLSMWAGVDVETEYNLDMTTFEYFIKINGQDATSAYSASCGSGTMMSLSGMTNEDIQNADGFWHTLEITNLPQKLPDGKIEMTILYYIYDCDIDDMGAVGNIGRVVHTFTFDATEGNRAEVSENAVQLKGNTVLTFIDWEKEEIYNRTVCLDEIPIDMEVSYGKTGIHVTLKADPSTNELEYCELFSYDYGDGDNDWGIGFDLYVDGEFVKPLHPLDSAVNELNLELPIFPSEYAEIESIVLRPVAACITGVSLFDSNMEASEEILPLVADGASVNIRGGSSFRTFEKQPLMDCDIVIALPNN